MHKTLKRRFMLLGIPAAVGFAVFYIYPFIKSIGYSFIESNFSSKFVWFDNYKAVLSNEFFRLALKNTVIFSVVGVAGVVVLAFLMSIGLVKMSKKYSLIKSAFILPYVLPSVSIIFVWQMIFSSDGYSTLASVLGSRGLFDVLPLYLIFIWKNIGIDVILITAALSKLPQEIYEAAALDCASGLRIHLKITLLLISPSLLFVTVFSFVNSLKIFKESYLFYNSNYHPDSAYMIQNFMNNNFFKLNYQNLSTAVTMFTLIVAVIILVIYKLVNSISE